MRDYQIYLTGKIYQKVEQSALNDIKIQNNIVIILYIDMIYIYMIYIYNFML